MLFKLISIFFSYSQTVEALKAGLKEIQRGIDAMRSEWLGSTSMGSPSSSSSASSTASRCSTQISQITDSLYLCSARAVSEGNVRALGITCVVNVTLELPFMPLGTGIEYMKVCNFMARLLSSASLQYAFRDS
jgi:uncharacterized protein YukE